MTISPRVFGSRGSFDMFRKALDPIRSFPESVFPPARIIIPKTLLPFIIMHFHQLEVISAENTLFKIWNSSISGFRCSKSLRFFFSSPYVHVLWAVWIKRSGILQRRCAHGKTFKMPISEVFLEANSYYFPLLVLEQLRSLKIQS